MASRIYTNAGRSVSSPKGTTLKLDVLRCCELFRVRFSAPRPQTFGSYYVDRCHETKEECFIIKYPCKQRDEILKITTKKHSGGHFTQHFPYLRNVKNDQL
ncbi:hypothetical protein TNCV_1479811 [Trichonephila clavipes]|nr:hypothetical protein TNCV_1479811 [Trichonephila clavipes]